jgi:hypothetical protein
MKKYGELLYVNDPSIFADGEFSIKKSDISEMPWIDDEAGGDWSPVSDTYFAQNIECTSVWLKKPDNIPDDELWIAYDYLNDDKKTVHVINKVTVINEYLHKGFMWDENDVHFTYIRKKSNESGK